MSAPTGTACLRRGLASAAAALALVACTLAPAPAQAAPQARTSLPVIERQVMCVTCKIPLNVAQSPQADRERAYIQSLIERGDSEAEIKDALVGQYGPTVLGLPRASGFDLTVYLVPAAVVLGLALLLVLLLPRWRRQARAQASAGEPAPALSSEDASRLDADLARFD